jgi:ATP-binding protein involved in chromosome partitioning
MNTREEILEILSKIPDPDSKIDIVSANLVTNLTLEDHQITVEIACSNPALHARKRMEEAVVFRLKNELRVPAEIHCIVRAMKSDERKGKRSVLPEVTNVIAIASGKGGVGKSTVTANLAAGLVAEGYSVGLIDADIYGPSIPTMFDVQGQRPHLVTVDDKSLIEPITSYGVKLLSIGFFTDQDNAVVWRGPMASKALTQMITEGNWGRLDFLLVDLPPGTGDVHLSLAQTLPLDGVVIVSTPQEVALADARRGINMFSIEGLNVPIVGMVENMAWFTPAELPENRYYLFGRDGAKNLAHGLNIPFLGAIPLVQSIRESGDVGRPAVLQKGSSTGMAFTELVHTFVTTLTSLKQKK